LGWWTYEIPNYIQYYLASIGYIVLLLEVPLFSKLSDNSCPAHFYNPLEAEFLQEIDEFG